MNFVLKIVAIGFLMYGVATGIGRALWGELWLGFVLTGGALLVGGWIASTCTASAKRKHNAIKVKALLDTLDVGLLTQKYPLYAAGIAGAVGFLMAGGKASSTAPLYSMALQVAEEIAAASLLQCQNNMKNHKEAHMD